MERRRAVPDKLWGFILFAIAVVLTLPLLGSAIDQIFDNIRGELEAAPGGSGGS